MKISKEAAKSYHVCLHDNCPMASHCLHHIAYESLVQTEKYLQLINPNRCSKDAACTYYRSATPVTYAWGFIGIQSRLPAEQYQQFMAACQGVWSRNGYFLRRRGKWALSPDEQTFILDTLRSLGITGEMKFDKYEESYTW